MNKDQFINFIPDVKEIQESPLLIEGREVAYNSSVILKNGYCIGSGFSLNPSKARTIALSEAVERKAVASLFRNCSLEQKKLFLLDEYPTTCGFAVGATTEDTKRRAISEAVERWIRSKWIDEKYLLEEISISNELLTEVERYFVEQFHHVRIFVNSCSIIVNHASESVRSVIVVGLTEKGAFVGSKSKMNSPAPLLAALVEAWRHLQLSKINDNRTPEIAVIKYFAEHRTVAEEQIARTYKNQLPNPELRILEDLNIPIDGVFCYRALCKDYQSWHGSDVTRFVY
ncbi:MAG: hypothetical protein KF865_08495 [Bdellovibrionaceae bacterium]|nr:hypothetical protein [Pseudobdellovibrionaceae bacterium]